MEYLHRHPSEVELTLDEIADVMWAGDEIFKVRLELAKASL